MNKPAKSPVPPESLRLAVKLFIEQTYGTCPPPAALEFLPPEGDFDAAKWLMGDQIERMPPGAPLEEVCSFALRIGSKHYRHMKLRLSRPGRQPVYVFMADAHDAFLEAEPGSPDHDGLIALKQQNAATISRITEAWDKAGLRTEKNYLRLEIRQMKDEAGPEAAEP